MARFTGIAVATAASFSSQPSSRGRFKTRMGDGEDKPSTGFENASHGAENGLQIRDSHECQNTHGAIKACLCEGLSILSIILKVLNAQRVLLFRASCQH